MIGVAALASPFRSAACARVQSALDPAADQARAVQALWHLMLGVCGFMFALTLIFLAWAIVQARRGNARRGTAAPDDRTLTRMLYGWIGLIVTGLVVLTIASFLTDRDVLHAEPGALRVRITGHQWWWQVEYPASDPAQTVMTANELHLPLDRAVAIELRTDDVIHSLWIPNLAGKLDLIPGRTNTLYVTPRRVGLFRGQCAEFCGLQHAQMALDVSIDRDEDYARWYAHQLAAANTPGTDDARDGARLFLSGPCVMCHAVHGTDASARAGPDLTHFASRATLGAGARPLIRDNVRAWIADPQRIKPGAHMPAMPLDERELDRVADYLMTLD